MEAGSTIIGLLMMALLVVPVILIARSGKGSKSLEKDFLVEVSRSDLKIDEKDFWNNYAIGIDKSNNRIIYFNMDEPEKFTIIINIGDVKVVETNPKA